MFVSLYFLSLKSLNGFRQHLFLFDDNFFVVIKVHQEIVQEMYAKTLHTRTMQACLVLLMVLHFLVACSINVCLTTKINVVEFTKEICADWLTRGIYRPIHTVYISQIQAVHVPIVCRIGKYEHITPVLVDLHWLPVHYRIVFKILLLVHA